MIRKFWWGYSGDTKKIHWVKWERLCEVKEVGGMGFKEIEKFNQALLAKQMWRMINNPYSLCHKVFKARFFPECSILEANDTRVGLYAWKSILSARDVVKRGLVWQIGDGASVSIKEDKWIPDQCYRTVASHLPNIPPDAKVSSLVDPVSCEWRTDVILQMFLPHESRIILRIPLSLNLPCDRLIWSKTPFGLFTTRSAYKLLAGDAMANNPSSSNPSPQKAFWKGLWMLRIPSKEKHFVWRACNDALPTMVNLLRRHIVASDVCEVCNSLPKDTLHAVWGCKELEGVWRQLSWACPTMNPPPGDFSNLLSGFLQVSDDYRAEIFTIITWLLWTRRNNLRLGLSTKPLSQITPTAGGMLQDFLNVQEKKSEAVQMPSPMQ